MRARMDSLLCNVGPIVRKAPQRGRDETRPFTVLALAGGSAHVEVFTASTRNRT